MENSIVYKITSPSGKYYIGSTNNLQRRLREHSEGTKNHHCLYIERAYKKYGEDQMILTILHSGLSREDAYTKEQEYLDKYFDDDLCMNLKSKAKGFSSEQAKIARSKVRNVFDIAKHMEENPHKRLKGNLKPKVKKIATKIPSSKEEAKKELTTREYKEWYKNNKPDRYAIKEPDGKIVYLKYGELTSYCKKHNIQQSKLHTKGYCNNYFFTKDLSKKGITNLKKAKYINNKGNSKLYKVYKDGVYLETISNLTQWCKEKGLNYTSANNRVRSIVKSDYNGYNFKLI